MRKEGVAVQTATLETGHCPNLTAAKEVTDIVDAVAKGTLQSDSANDGRGTSKDDVREAIVNVSG